METLEGTSEKLANLSSVLIDYLIEFGPRALLAIIALVVGFKFAGYLKNIITKAMDRQNFDPTLKPFISNLIGWMFKILVIISVAGIVGIETTSFIAVLGAAGLAVGLSLQGTLANFAGGVLILILKPFKAGDVIDNGSFMGTVESIQIFYTKVNTFQNRKVVIPNAELSNGSITNYSANDIARIDMVFGISYGSDIKKAKEILEELVAADDRCLKDPAPIIAVGGLGDSAVDILCRPWTSNDDYYTVFRDFQEKVKLKFDEAGIEIPFPQRDVHMKSE